MKEHVSLLLMALMSISLMPGRCGKGDFGTPGIKSQAKIQTEVQTEPEAGGRTIVQSGDKTAPGQASKSPSGESSSPAPESGVGGELNMGFGENRPACRATIRTGPLEGPTSTELMSLMDKTSKGETSNVYEFTMAGKVDELVGKIADGDLDIALVPTNVASVLYAKTQGNIIVLDINTLGVLYVVTSDDFTTSMAGLEGYTIYMTGEGTTPRYATNYFLEENGLSTSDVDLQFKFEVIEMASLLKQGSSVIDVLPQPFAVVACIQNPSSKAMLDLTEQWNILNKDSRSMLVTGITLVCGDFLRENCSPAVDFIEGHETSTLFAKKHTEGVAQLIVEQGIVEKAPAAQKAPPYCNIACLTGQEAKSALGGYLSTLNEQNPRSIGGRMPGDDFYYMP